MPFDHSSSFVQDNNNKLLFFALTLGIGLLWGRFAALPGRKERQGTKKPREMYE